MRYELNGVEVFVPADATELKAPNAKTVYASGCAALTSHR